MTDATPAPDAEKLEVARHVYADYGEQKAKSDGAEVDKEWVLKVLAGDADGSHGVQIALAALNATHPATPTEPSLSVEREALEWYRDQMCEGICGGFTPRICQALMDENPTGGDCSGCRAVLALSTKQPEPSGEGSDEWLKKSANFHPGDIS